MRRGRQRELLGAALAAVLVFGAGAGRAQDEAAAPPAGAPFLGGLREVASEAPRAVRNAAHQPGREVVTLRYFKIKPGTFPEFLAASRDGVWPYFEKIGARVLGMWRVIPPPGARAEARDYDEVYLATRYASLEHWAATRDTVAHGGNGPDWQACERALDLRDSLTLASHVVFLEGELAPGGPYFMPGLAEKYEPVD
jgi:hypothetical protein